jgi:hypothetical protein
MQQLWWQHDQQRPTRWVLTQERGAKGENEGGAGQDGPCLLGCTFSHVMSCHAV